MANHYAFLECINQWIKNSLFPIFCLGCKKEGKWVCVDCKKEIVSRGIFTKEHGALDSHLAIFSYTEDNTIGKLIQCYKYEYAEDIKYIWRDYIAEYIGSIGMEYFSNIDMIVPVPLHPRRFAERGFNQAEQIAVMVGERSKKSVERVLRRTRYTEKQAGLKRDERLKNVNNAFVLNKKYGSIKNKSVLLVDDVFTTGSTMQACALALRQNGASYVSGFTLARA